MKTSYRLKCAGLLVCLLSISCFVQLHAQRKNNYTTAVLVYDGVQLLDLAGPCEVLSNGGGIVKTVSVDGKPVITQAMLKIHVDCSIDSLPIPDIIILPGGRQTPSNDPKVLTWVKSCKQGGSFIMSVCTGAFILANAGLLNGKSATTHQQAIADLASKYNSVKVVNDARYIDNGDIITTAGVSAGIDGELYLYSRIKGIDEAQASAIGMEYVAWKPEKGLINYANGYLNRLKIAADNQEADTPVPERDEQIPFQGDFRNIAAALMSNNKYREAAYITEAAIKIYPDYGPLFNDLTKMNNFLGRPSPTDKNIYTKMFLDGKTDSAIALYKNEKSLFPTWPVLTETDMLRISHMLRQKGDHASNLRLLEFDLSLRPNSAAAYTVLGMGLEAAQKTKDALIAYKKSLALNPSNHQLSDYINRLENKIGGK